MANDGDDGLSPILSSRNSKIVIICPFADRTDGGRRLGRERERCSRERQTNRLMSTYRSSDDCRSTKGPLRSLNRDSKSLKFMSLSRKRCGEPSLGGTRAMEKIVHDDSSCGSLISFSAQTLSSERRPITVPNRTEAEGRKKRAEWFTAQMFCHRRKWEEEFLPSLPLTVLPTPRLVQTQYGAETDGEKLGPGCIKI